MSQPQHTYRPHFLMCSMCGREFGTASLPIHQKSCLKKNGLSSVPIPAPSTPLSSREKAVFNDRATQNFVEQVLIACETCGRKFQEASLKRHQTACRPGGIYAVQMERRKEKLRMDGGDGESVVLGVRREKCGGCGRMFVAASLAMHVKSCQGSNVSKAVPAAKVPRPRSIVRSETSDERDRYSLAEQPLKHRQTENTRSQVAKYCVQCGRDFGNQTSWKFCPDCGCRRS